MTQDVQSTEPPSTSPVQHRIRAAGIIILGLTLLNVIISIFLPADSEVAFRVYDVFLIISGTAFVIGIILGIFSLARKKRAEQLVAKTLISWAISIFAIVLLFYAIISVELG